MCPEQQILSIYVDGELPSPWKEKLEDHLKGCSGCKTKTENYRQLRELFKKDNYLRRTFVEKAAEDAAKEKSNEPLTEPEMTEAAKSRVWRKLESRQRLKMRARSRRSAVLRNVWRRKLSIPLPAAAAAAAVIIALLTAIWLRDNGRVNQQQNSRTDFILAEEEEIPGIIPAADINGVLQYLTSNGTDVIILNLPESSSFSRTGEPAIIRAADYSSRRHQ